jgi:hypothetical protein
MNQNCQHCGELIVGDVYRVTSEDQGITLLDLVVCALCSMPNDFGCIPRKSMLGANKFQHEVE